VNQDLLCRLSLGIPRQIAICGDAAIFTWRCAWIVDKARKRQQNFRDPAAKQRLTVKGGRAYNPRLPETAGTTSSVDGALKVVFALEGRLEGLGRQVLFFDMVGE
jgi:hypothetical protein